MYKKNNNLVSTALILLVSFSAHATLVEHLSTAQMTQQSKSIHIGKITNQYSSWDAESKMVYTYVKLNVSKTIKGTQNQEVLMKIPGGEASGVKIVVHGVAHFKKGEETLVFLRHHKGAPTLVGMSQGKYIVSQDPNTGKMRVSRKLPKSLELISRKVASSVNSIHSYQKIEAHGESSLDLDSMIKTIEIAMEKKQ